MSNQWYLAYTRPLHEKKIATQFDLWGIEYFLPMTKSLRVWSDRKKYISIPLFPSYIFVSLPDAESYYQCLQTKGLLYFIKNDGKIAAINETLINHLKQVVTDCVEIKVTADQVPRGEKLIINSGPFTGFTCETICLHGKRKILVRIDLIQRTLIADIPLHQIMPIKGIS
ncbi:MAG TPA: UpxY family transcription antiterminator [Niabella sp.]|nr:UpxY family transcription antiterminator [Niabella sp.]HOZ97733.1 UpxY family transcription antiterminator [Niabella sp.]HQW14048.1 UpxY family transcription antiterminator [Niabella sp.]HQX19409.1 UpxY family transcription antiterminator [Niabella sp.]HQX40238.1 UpxY family transcription antiterminator [Niabella sp.]